MQWPGGRQGGQPVLPSCHQVAVDHGPAGPGQARREVERWAHDTGIGTMADDLTLIVSELVTNAVRYGAPPVHVEVRLDERALTVTVVDADPGPPVPTSPGHEAEGGRGLLLIDLLAAEHGVRPEPPGKAVWAVLPR